MKVNDFLVKHCHISKDEASTLIAENRVRINKKKAIQKQYIIETDLVEFDERVLQEPVIYKYYAFYKPRGIECTLNPSIKNNLLELLPFAGHFYPVGRLDKESEGLLLITNDGNFYQQIALSDKLKEKEYVVEVNAEISDADLEKLGSGVLIMRDKKTRPAVVTRINSHTFRIILTQGLNRQIRRMCHTLGLQVTSLKRVRISSVELGKLEPGTYRELQATDVQK